jgi:hypothetical protein
MHTSSSRELCSSLCRKKQYNKTQSSYQPCVLVHKFVCLRVWVWVFMWVWV